MTKPDKMSTMLDPVLIPAPSVTSVTAYRAGVGGRALARAQELGPGGTIQELALSGLRGRGGAGFPTARKWQSVLDSVPGPASGPGGSGEAASEGNACYVVCNGAEGEPGTFKDRTILLADPYQVIEGVAVASFVLGARQAFIALKASFRPQLDRLERALTEMEAAGLAGEVPIAIVAGPEEYLFGEETGLLQVIEGEAPLPRLLPPYLHGLFATAPESGWSAGPRSAGRPPTTFSASNPTLVNNVETLATVTHVLARGPEWHRSHGTASSPGRVVCTVVGDVVRPGVAEVELGTPLRTVIDDVGGGARAGRQIKAVLSGVSNPVLRGDQLDTPVSYEGMEAAGSGLGSCGFVVYDDTADMVEVASAVSRFLHVESCGQCPACKLGTAAITDALDALTVGTAAGDTVERIGARLRSVTDGNRCYLPVQEQRVIASLLRAFPEDFVAAGEGVPVRLRGLGAAKLVDVSDGTATLDARQARKRPDWTYE